MLCKSCAGAERSVFERIGDRCQPLSPPRLIASTAPGQQSSFQPDVLRAKTRHGTGRKGQKLFLGQFIKQNHVDRVPSPDDRQ